MKHLIIKEKDIDLFIAMDSLYGKQEPHEALVSHCGLRQWLEAQDAISIDDIIQWYKRNGVNLDCLVNDENLVFQQCWDIIKGQERGHYFRFRHATNSYLTGIHLLKNISGRMLVDLGCGVGHFSAFYRYLVSSSVAVDAEVVNLLILHKYFSQNTKLYCGDLESGLDFSNGYTDNVFVSDVLHYVENKKRFLHEIKRIWDGSGTIIFNHVHHKNQLAFEEGIGSPLLISDYLKLFRQIFVDCNIEIYSETAFISYVTGSTDVLKPATENEYSAIVCIISKTKKDFINHEQIKIPIEKLKINPLYNFADDGENIILDKKVLPKSFTKEFVLDFFPKRITIRKNELLDIEKIVSLFYKGVVVL